MKFVESRPYSDPSAAARQLLALVQDEIAATKAPYAYTGTVNSAFVRSGGNVAEYRAGIDAGRAGGLFEVDSSGTRISIKTSAPVV